MNIQTFIDEQIDPMKQQVQQMDRRLAYLNNILFNGSKEEKMAAAMLTAEDVEDMEINDEELNQCVDQVIDELMGLNDILKTFVSDMENKKRNNFVFSKNYEL